MVGVVQEDDDGEQAVTRKAEPKATTPAPETAGGPSWKGKLLTDFLSDELVKLRAWCVKANPTRFAPEVEAIDTILAGRQGA